MPRVDVPDYKTFVDFPDGTPPEEMQSVLAKQFPKKPGIIDRVVKGPLARAAQGVNSSLGGALSAFGLDSGAEAYKQGAEYWKQKADAAGSSGIPAQIYEGLGGAPMGVAEFVAGVPYAGAKGAAKGYREGGVPGALKEGALEAAKRAGIGKVFHGIGGANLTPLQRSGAMAGTMGAQTAAEGGSLSDVVAATATGALLMPPSGGGAQSVVRSRMQSAGASPEVAADLSGRFDPRVQPAGMGSINANNVDTMFAADPARPPAIRDSEVIALTGNESRPPQQARGTVLDAENASRLSPYDAIGPSPGISIEVARLKQEHPYWSDAEYLREIEKTRLTENPEVLPAATGMSTVRPVTEPERPAEQAPSRTVEPQSMENFNHDSLPTAAVTAKDSLVLQDAAPQLKIAVVGTPAEIKALGKQPTGKTTWVNGDKAYIIDTAAARDKYGSVLEAKRALKAGGDAESEVLGYPPRGESAIDTTVNNGTIPPKQSGGGVMDRSESTTIPVERTAELINEGWRRESGGANGTSYLYDTEGQAWKYDGIGRVYRPSPSTEMLELSDRLHGRAPLQTAAVTKAGEILIEPEAIKQAATAGEVAYAAEGAPADLAAKIEPVADALKPDPTMLHAGIHLPTLVKQAKDTWKHYTEKLDPTAPAGSVKEFQERNAVANKQFGKDGIFRAARRAMLDTSANAQNELMARGLPGQWARREYDAISGATGRSEYRKEKARSAIIDGLSLRERQAFDRKVPLDRELAIAEYRGSQFNVEVDKQHTVTAGGIKFSYKTKETTPDDYTFMGGFTPEQIKAARERFQKDYKLTDAEQASSDKATKAYFEAWKGNTGRLLEAGLIDATQKAELDSHLYSPKQFLDKIDPFVKTSSGASVPDSGIKRLDKGSDRYYRDNPMALLEEAIDRVETRIARNEANQALAAIPDGTGIFTRPDRADAPVPPGSVALRYMEKGEQKVLHVNEEFAKEWEATDPMLNPLLAAAMEVGTGRGAVRAAATGHNPLFAVVNMPVDALTIWAQPEGYSPHLPVALYQMAGNLMKVKGDAWKHEGRYEDWVMKEKGGRDMLTQYGSMTSRRSQLQPEVRKVLNATSKIGRFSEEVSRLAYREQLIKSGKDPLVAGKMAAEYVDFSRGGWLTKALDKMGAVYLNAGMQGFRSMARASGKNPALFAYKVAQLGLVASTLYGFNQLVNPDGWRNVDDKTKADNFIVMTPPYFNYVDKNGTTVSPYFKIKKEQFIRPFTSIAEALWQMAYEGKDPRQQIKFAIEGANPLSISKLIPPTGKLYMAYAHNVDIFKERPVWRGKQDIAPFAEYTQTTNPILTAIGKATATTGKDGQLEGGVSPERLGAALSQVIIPSNLFVNTGIGALTRAFEKMNPSDKVEFAKGNYEKLVDFLGGTRLLGGAKDTEQFREGIREARTGTATQQFEVNKTLDAMVLRYVKTGKSDAALYDRISDFLDKQSGESRSRLENRITGLMETADLPDRGWWMAVRALQPEDRADQFKARLQTVSPEEQQRMIQIADGLTGFVSDRFIERYEGAQ